MLKQNIYLKIIQQNSKMAINFEETFRTGQEDLLLPALGANYIVSF